MISYDSFYSAYKNVIKAIYNDLSQVNVTYMIAGGFPRDIYLGKCVKDIDIFYWGDFPFEELKGKINFLEETEDTGDYTNNICTHKGSYCGFDIDFIKVAPIYQNYYDVLNSFPASISQIGIVALTSGFSVITTPSFQKTIFDKHIVVASDCPIKYYNKIKDKFPEMSINELFQEMPKKKISPNILLKKKYPLIQYKVINYNSLVPIYREFNY